MNFRFDLSKAEAKRGLCFKSFCCLLDQVYKEAGGSSGSGSISSDTSSTSASASASTSTSTSTKY